MFYFYWNKFFPDIFAFFAPPRFFYSFRLTHSVSFAIGIWPNYSLFFPLISLHLHRATDSLRFFFFCSPMEFFLYTFVPFFSRAHSPFFRHTIPFSICLFFFLLLSLVSCVRLIFTFVQLILGCVGSCVRMHNLELLSR